METIIFATKNKGKIKEINEILADMDVNVISIEEAGITIEWVRIQIKCALAGVSAEDAKKVIVAYEPIWAIGTGMVATPQSAQDAARAIRNDLSDTFGTRVGETVRILYGGSVSSKNAVELINEPDVDGFLIGGSALKVDELTRICKLTLETTA